MSNALAIGAVTAVLKGVLENTLAAQNVIPSVNVTTLPPDRVVPANPANNTDDDQLNLFLYQITPNAAWRNTAFPSRDAKGERLSNPPLALDLHYFVTAYGQKPFHAEIILGFAMLALHEASVLTREQIKKSLAAAVPADLAKSRVAEQVEQLKVTQEVLVPEEISKLWSAITAHYRPTAAYCVSVVLMEVEQSTKGALPVRSVGAQSVPAGPPLIESVRSAAGMRAPIVAGSVLHILGQNLKAERVQVRVGELLLSPQPTLDDITEQRIVYQLPAVLPAGLFAGMKPLRIEHLLDLSQPPAPHEGSTSNVEPFMLRPQIVVATENVVSSQVNGVAVRGGTLKIDFTPQVGRSQSVVVVLNEFSAVSGARGYSFQAPPDNGIADPNQPSVATIRIPFSNVAAGRYLVRVRVDGAESVLQQDASGLYVQPLVDLT